jgi:hypothetical protein
MEPLPQEHRAAITAVFKSPSALVLKHLPKWDFALGEQQFTNLKVSLKKMATDLGGEPFLLEIRQDNDSAGVPLTVAAILKANALGVTRITLGASLNVLRIQTLYSPAEALTTGPVEISAASQSTILMWRASSDTVNVFANGQLVDFFDLRSPDKPPAMASRFGRRADDYELSILDHYRCCVRYWETDHWEDRRGRKLRKRLGSANNTEAIFHRDLHRWLKINLDAQVYSKAKDTSGDELDIIILSPQGRSYAVELKWIGTSSASGERDFSYTITTVADGLDQLRTYLNKQTKIVCASLVAYDGRTESEFAALKCIDDKGPDGCKRLDSCEGRAVPPRGNCMILFLENKTASE